MDQMEAAQREFLDAQRRWNADEKGDLKLLEICSDAEQHLVAAFFVGWIADMRLKNLAYSHFRKALVQYNGGKWTEPKCKSVSRCEPLSWSLWNFR